MNYNSYYDEYEGKLCIDDLCLDDALKIAGYTNESISDIAYNHPLYDYKIPEYKCRIAVGYGYIKGRDGLYNYYLDKTFKPIAIFDGDPIIFKTKYDALHWFMDRVRYAYHVAKRYCEVYESKGGVDILDQNKINKGIEKFIGGKNLDYFYQLVFTMLRTNKITRECRIEKTITDLKIGKELDFDLVSANATEKECLPYRYRRYR